MLCGELCGLEVFKIYVIPTSENCLSVCIVKRVQYKYNTIQSLQSVVQVWWPYNEGRAHDRKQDKQ